jgi:hypothetical protein
MGKTAVVFTCSHSTPEVSNERFSILGKFLYDLKPDYVIDLGDGADMKSLNTYDTRSPKAIVAQSYEADINHYNDAQERLRWLFRHHKRKRPYWIGFEGNHECFQDFTEIFTKDRGWVFAPDLTEDDEVLTLNGWEKVQKVHKYFYEGPMVNLNSFGKAFSVTPSHRVYYYTTAGNLLVKPAKDLPAEFDAPVATTSNQTGLPLTDDQLRFCAIALTDSYHSGSKITFYQSGLKAQVFRDLLPRLGIEYKEIARDRDITEICGRKLLSTQVSYEFHMVRPDWSPTQNRRIPKEFFSLSQSQAEVFLDMLIFCDGSTFSDRQSTVFYGRREICDDVQGFCQAYGSRASLTEYRTGHWRVNINPRHKLRFKTSEGADISEFVYCLTVPSENFLARQNGLSMFTGNCRIKKAISVDPRLEGSKYGISFSHLQTDYWFDDYHEYDNGGPAIADYDGVSYAHYFSSGNYGTATSGQHHAYTILNNRLSSSTCGHSHKRSIYFKDGAHPNGAIGLVAGCFKGAKESWAGQANNEWATGVCVKREIENGMYDFEWVSLKALERQYG